MEQIPEIIHESWHQHLQPLFDDPKMQMIKTQILPSCRFFPESEYIFRVFGMPLEKIKVVIIGQDPYPNGEAIGYSFAVDNDTKIPGSLKVIKNEIINSKVERDTHYYIESEKWKTLAHWRQQGVFLLNAALTVEFKNSGSHVGIWSWFAREVVNIISKQASPIWLLWGSKAIAFKSSIFNYQKWAGYILRTPNANYGLEAVHPAAELYPESKYKFTGCNHFNLCNEILKKIEQKIINW